MIRILILIILLGSAGVRAGSSQDAPLTVFAASSLTNALEDIARSFEAVNPGVEVIFNFGNSSALAEQINVGAPADVFASANWIQMQKVVDAGLAAQPPTAFARNQLALIVPATNPGNVQSPRDLASPGLLLVLPTSGVPARVYADSLLSRIASVPTFGTDWLNAVYANLVSEEDNVRLAQVKVALGEAGAGIVYASDITPDVAGDVQAIPLPAGAQPVISYPIAALTGAADKALAGAFVDYVLSPDGQAALARWGFVPVAPVTP
jgi:molybdate transport system substrate-binding protein